MKNIKEIEIDFNIDGQTESKKFKITMFNPDQGFDLVLRLSKVIGPALLALQGFDPNQELNEVLSDLLTPLFQNINVPETKQLIYDLLSCVIHKNETLTKFGGNNLNMVFQANYMKIFKICVEVVKHNRFLDQAGELAGL